MAKASDCGSEDRGFESHHPPHKETLWNVRSSREFSYIFPAVSDKISHFRKWKDDFSPLFSPTGFLLAFPLQCVKKASQSLPPAGGKEILIIFCRGAPQGGLSCPFGAIHLLYLTENTTQAASVRLVRCKRTRRARSRLQSFCQKGQSPFLTVSIAPEAMLPGQFRKQKEPPRFRGGSGDLSGIRTPDPLLKRQLLCRLS